MRPPVLQDGGDAPELHKVLGSLPLVAAYIERAGIAEAVDKVCPSARQAIISHADAVVALVANRLTTPRPLYRVEDWASEFGVKEVLGLEPEALNDDRLGTALEVLADKALEIQGAVTLAAVERFNIDLSRLHMDWTKLIFHGSYDRQDPEYPQVQYSYPTTTVPRGSRVLTSQTVVTEDGAVPVFARAFDGAHAEVSTVVSGFERLKELAGPLDFILVGDSKLLCAATIDEILLGDRHFLAPLTDNKNIDEAILNLPEAGWQPLAYISEREGKRPLEQQRHFSGQEVTYTHEILLGPDGKKYTDRKVEQLRRKEKVLDHLQNTVRNYKSVAQLQQKVEKLLCKGEWSRLLDVSVIGPETGRPTEIVVTKKYTIREFPLRKLFILSDEERQACRTSREKRMDKTDKDLENLQKTVSNYNSVTQLQKKVEKLLEKRKVKTFYTVSIEGVDKAAKPVQAPQQQALGARAASERKNQRPTSLTFSQDKDALARAQRLDGIYVLSTSDTAHSLNELLTTYKQQYRLEARYADWKGPIEVRPIYLKNNKRIVGLHLVLAIALLVYTLIERDARKALESEGGIMEGLYPEGRMSRPTSKQILRVFSQLQMRWTQKGGQQGWLADPLNAVQQKVLGMLNVDYPWP